LNKKIASGDAGSIQGFWGRLKIYGSRLLLKELYLVMELRKKTQQNQRRLSSLVLHAPEDPHALEDDSSPGRPVQVEECCFNKYHLRLLRGSQDLRQQEVAEKIEIQTRYAAESFTTWTSGRISDIWLIRAEY
jgi:hypothetical protein